jgi:hypothetical protein
MLKDIVNIELTEDLRKKIKSSDELYTKLLYEIGIPQYKRFKQILPS